jgi:hypothetical protein
MGNNQSSLPSGKNYIISYCKHLNFKNNFISNETNLINGININKSNQSNLIISVFYNKINSCGYSLKPSFTQKFTIAPLEVILNKIKDHGFYSSNKEKKLSDIIIKPKCYTPKLKIIKSLIYLGNVLIAGLVIDPEFAKNVLNTNITEIVTDIVLIVGYTEKEIIIKGVFSEFVIPNEYISSIKEVWNIEIESPEELFLENKI